MSAPEQNDDDELKDEVAGDLDDAAVDAAFAEIIARWRSEGPPPGPSAPGAPGAPETGSDHGAPDQAAPGAPTRDEPTPDDPAPSESGPSSRPRQEPDGPSDTAAIEAIFAARRDRIEREIDFAVDGPDGGRFVAPEPEPLPRLDMFTLLAWAAALLGPVLIIIGAFTGGLVPQWILGAAVVATIAGFVVLVSRLPSRRDADPDDDGAVV